MSKRCFDGRHYGGWDVMLNVFGPIGIRYQRVSGKPETWAGFTEDGKQITQFSNNGPIEKNELLPWAECAMREHAK